MINVLISADSRYQVDKNFLKQVTISALEQRKVKGKIEVSIAIVGGRAMTDLNKTYLKRDNSCEILVFPQEETRPVHQFSGANKTAGFVKPQDKVLRLGDIVISYPQALAAAAKSSIQIEEELQDLVEYGIDRLLGIHQE